MVTDNLTAKEHRRIDRVVSNYNRWLAGQLESVVDFGDEQSMIGFNEFCEIGLNLTSWLEKARIQSEKQT